MEHAHSSRKEVIVISKVSKSFGKKPLRVKILKELDLTIYEGEFLMIFGPSGCGKSTLINTMLGLEKPDGGSVTFFGIDIWGLDEDDRAEARKRHVGIMNQHQHWIRSLNVRENTAFPLQLLGADKRIALIEADDNLRKSGIDHRAHYRPTELSAGEQQRVSLARAMVTNPKIVITDEPTGNLDVNSGFQFMDSVKNIQKAGSTIVMVTHNPEYLGYADRVVFMLDGKIQKDIMTAGQDLKAIRREMTEDLSRFIADGMSSNGNGTNNGQKPTVASMSDIELPSEGLAESVGRKLGKIASGFRYFADYFVRISKYLVSRLLDPITRLSSKENEVVNHVPGSRLESDVISGSISRNDLIDLSYRNIMVKKSRTYVTMLAMGIGVGFIAFLSSIGYGIRDLVISEIASIGEMRQIEVVPAVGSNLELTDESLAKIEDIEGISSVLPLISVASRVEYQSSLIDVVAHGVQASYVEQLPDEIIAGESYSSEALVVSEHNEDYVREIVVNEPLLIAMGLTSNSALGVEVGVSYVFMDESEEDVVRKETEYVKHVITGVISDENPPIIYTPIINIKMNGFSTYTQVISVLESDDEDLSVEVRKKIEAMGFETRSILDTVSQVNAAFRYIQMVLLLIGFVALVVSVLGMFNTLTVSLLERTHEVGLMKAIGMKSYEIRDLFISESMLISIAGGAIGLILGILEGHALSLILSIISISRGDQAIDITQVPIFVMIEVLVMAGFVGFLTGLYPSRRAVKMSALDALRYE